MFTMAFLTILVAILVVVFIFNARSHRRRQEYFSARQKMELCDWATCYFPECDDSQSRIVCELARVITSSIGCHATQLLPSDIIDGRLLLPRIAFLARADEWETWWNAICTMTSQYERRNANGPTRVLHPDSWRTFGDLAREVVECFSRAP